MFLVLISFRGWVDTRALIRDNNARNVPQPSIIYWINFKWFPFTLVQCSTSCISSCFGGIDSSLSQSLAVVEFVADGVVFVARGMWREWSLRRGNLFSIWLAAEGGRIREGLAADSWRELLKGRGKCRSPEGYLKGENIMKMFAFSYFSWHPAIISVYA